MIVSSFRSSVSILACVASCALSLFACGGNEPTPAAPTKSQNDSDPMIRPVTPGQLKVTHLATRDGRIGLVLDRSGPKPKMARDGSKDIVELTLEEDRSARGLRGHYLVDPTGARRMYLSESGGYTLYEGRDELTLMADRSADPLGPATIAGAPKKEKSAVELASETLTPIAVRTRMPAMKPEDSSRLAKIEEAIKGATADMFVRWVVREGPKASPYWKPTPDSFGGTAYGGVAHRIDEKWEPTKATGLKKYGGTTRGFSHPESQGNHINVVTLDGYPAPLASGTPGLVWEVDGSQAVFVTLDGARYQLSIGQKENGLDMGAGPDDKWPAPVQHALLNISDATALVKVGEIPKKAEEELFAQDDEWNKCSQKVWQGIQRKIDTGKFTEADRKDMFKKAETTCAAPVQKQEKSFLALVEARAKARNTLFELARARVRDLSKK